MGDSAREVVLGRVRAAIGGPSDRDETAMNGAPIAEEWKGIRREYRRTAAKDAEGRLELLEDRLRDYDAGVYRCGADEVGAAVGKILKERGKTRMAVPRGVKAEWMAGISGVEFWEDEGGGVVGIDGCEGVLTGATLAIAETGTIVLQDVAGQGRRVVTLLPDYHLCVVEGGTVVATVPEAMAKLQGTAALATTFFSGPSATADIEMTRIKGVHGPRFVDVVLVV